MQDYARNGIEGNNADSRGKQRLQSASGSGFLLNEILVLRGETREPGKMSTLESAYGKSVFEVAMHQPIPGDAWEWHIRK